MRKAMFITLVLSLCMTVNAFAATNLLTNGDFEDGPTGNINAGIPGWLTWGSSGWHHDDPGRVIDTKAIKFWWDDAGVYQDFTATPGATYTFSVEVLNSTLETLTEWNGLIKAEFYDSSIGTEVGDAILELELDRYYSASDPVDEWFTIGGLVTAPANADIGRIVMLIVDWAPNPSGALNFDNASVVIGGAGTATDPEPEDGDSSLDPNSITRLKWQKPEPFSSANDWHDILCDAYISDGSNDVNSLTFQYHVDNPGTGTVIKLLTMADANSVSVSGLLADKTYLWRVDCYDPNNGNGGVGDIFTPGTLWSFDTINTAPTVDAGPKQAKWLPSSAPIEASFQLVPTVDDDGLPNPPASLTYLWTDSGPGTVTYNPAGGTTKNTEATMTTPGEYTLTLSVYDGQKTTEDSVTLRVYANNYTGLVAKWELDNDPCDSVGGYHGVEVGSPSYDVDAQVGIGSLLLDGNNYVEIPDSGKEPNLLDPLWEPTWADFTEELSISCWIKVNSFDQAWQAVVTKGDDSWRLHRDNVSDNVQFAFNGIGGVSSGSTGSVNDGEWHHIVGVYDGGMQYMYVDGILADSHVPDTDAGWLGAYNVRIGSNEQFVGREFNGRIDQVRIYEIGLPETSDHPGTPSVVSEFRADGGHNSCGLDYIPGDVDQNCYVELADFALVALNWLSCNDIGEAACD